MDNTQICVIIKIHSRHTVTITRFCLAEILVLGKLAIDHVTWNSFHGYHKNIICDLKTESFAKGE